MSCDSCTKSNILPGDPTGTISTDGITAYLASAPTPTSTRAIVLLTDAFGLPLKNCKILADELSKRLECDVWVPDLFNGDPIFSIEAATATVLPDRAGARMSFMDKLRLVFSVISRLHAFYRNRASVVDPKVASFVKKLKDEKKYDKIGAVGYCFGGVRAIQIGSTDLVNSVVICHPGRCNIDQIKAIKVPAAWACPEEDMSFGKELRLEAENVFAARKDKDLIEYEFIDYKGTTHGFAARPNLSIPEVKVAFEGSLNQTVNWFNKTL